MSVSLMPLHFERISDWQAPVELGLQIKFPDLCVSVINESRDTAFRSGRNNRGTLRIAASATNLNTVATVLSTAIAIAIATDVIGSSEEQPTCTLEISGAEAVERLEFTCGDPTSEEKLRLSLERAGKGAKIKVGR